MAARNEGIKKLIMPEHSTYARVSKDQAEIDEYLKRYGARQAVNSGKVFSFNNVEIEKRGAAV